MLKPAQWAPNVLNILVNLCWICTLKICTKCARWCNPTKPTNFCCWIVLILSKVDKSFTNELDNQNCHPYGENRHHCISLVQVGKEKSAMTSQQLYYRQPICCSRSDSTSVDRPTKLIFLLVFYLFSHQTSTERKKERRKYRRWSISHIYGSISDNDMLILTRITQYHTFRYGRGSRPFSYSFVNLTAKMDWLGGSRIVQHGEI